MAERSMAVVLKTTEPETVPGVRIPLSPPAFAHDPRELRRPGSHELARQGCERTDRAEGEGIAAEGFEPSRNERRRRKLRDALEDRGAQPSEAMVGRRYGIRAKSRRAGARRAMH